MSQHQAPPAPKKGEAITIKPGAYPVISRTAAMGIKHAMSSPEVAAAAEQAVADSSDGIRKDVLKQILRLDSAVQTRDFPEAYRASHEIRGLAGNGGLAATAKIADCLCRYLDALSLAGLTPEIAVVALHLGAVARSAQSTEDTAKFAETVVGELSQLVEKKLAGINESETSTNNAV